jgi:hypothetical protein
VIRGISHEGLIVARVRRAMLARISSAVRFQTKGWGLSLWRSRYSRMAASSSALRKMPVRVRLLVISANHRSTTLIQEP